MDTINKAGDFNCATRVAAFLKRIKGERIDSFPHLIRAL